jgi:uncharacterized membrane protein
MKTIVNIIETIYLGGIVSIALGIFILGGSQIEWGILTIALGVLCSVSAFATASLIAINSPIEAEITHKDIVI